MRLKELFNRVIDSRRDIQDRVFLLMTIPALLGLLVVFLIELAVGVDAKEEAILGGAFLLFTVITLVAVRRNRMRFGADLVAFLLVFVMLPLGFFNGGGVYGGSPAWFVFGMVFVGMAVPGKSRYFFQTACALVTVGCYLIAYRDPDFQPLLTRAEGTIYHNSVLSVLLSGFLISGLTSFEISMYREESKRSKEQREKIDQLIKSQNQFFSNMSHEIRTPINTIIGLNEMILREQDISDEVAEDAANIQAASRLLLHLINDILDMSKIESGKMELVCATYDVGAMLSDVVGMLWVRAKEKGLELHVDVDPEVPAELYGDEVRIKQVLINVLTNAIKYTREGSVRLSVLCGKQEGDKVLLTCAVSDTGIGIRKEQIPHLFSAFRRVDDEKNRYIEGTGLGLSIVKQLVDLMGGTITVNSVYRQGSTFIIDLPQRVVSERRLGKVNLEVRHALGRRAQYTRSFEAPDAHILVVDDDSANRLVVQKLLRDTKVVIDTAESGQEALKKTYETQYHLILMDHMMPEMDGVECLHQIRAQVGGLCRKTKVVVLTANAGSEERQMYVKEGFDGYLVKPVNGEALERELRRMLPRELITEMGDSANLAERMGVALMEQQKKQPVLIATGSICSLSRLEMEKRGIAVIPWHIRTESGVFLDGVETETRGVLDYIEERRGRIGITPPNLEEYEEFFAKQLLRAANVIYITLSSKIDKAYEIASGARQTFGNAIVFDSTQIAAGATFLVLAAGEMVKSGMSTDEILEELTEMRKRIRTSFIVNESESLAQAGRISHTVSRFANAFLLHPALSVQKGRLVIRRIFVGSKKHIWRRYIAFALRGRDTIDTSRLVVVYTGLSKDELEEIAAEVERRVHFDQIEFQKMTPAGSIVCGARMFGLTYRTKKRP